MFVAIKDLPLSLQRALASLGYHRDGIDTEVRDEVSPHYCADDGYRAVCAIVDLDTGAMRQEVGSWGGSNPFESRPVDVVQQKYPIPANCAVIKGQIGEKAFLHLYLGSANVLPMLDAPAPSLTIGEARVLYAHKGLKPAYRKGTYSAADLATMVKKKYIKQTKVGTSITVEGRNAFESWCKENHKSPFSMPTP